MSRAICLVILSTAVCADASRDEANANDLVHVAVKPASFQLSKPTDLLEKADAQAEEERALLELQNESSVLRHAVDELKSKEDSLEERAESMNKLAQFSKHVNKLAEDSDESIESKYTHLLEKEYGAGVAASKQAGAEEDEEEENVAASSHAELNVEAALDHDFAALEARTEGLRAFLADLREVKQARDELKKKQAHASKLIAESGLTQQEVMQALMEGLVSLNKEQVDSETPALIQTNGESVENITPEAEIHSIEKAAHEAMEGLAELQQPNEAHKTKKATVEKVEKAMKYLSTHEEPKGLSPTQTEHLHHLYASIEQQILRQRKAMMMPKPKA